MAPAPPTVDSIIPLIREFVPTDTRHVRRLVGQDVIATRKRANWRVYANPIFSYSLIPITLLALHLRQYIPYLSTLTSTPEGLSTWRSTLLLGTYVLAAASLAVVYVQVRHHRAYGQVMRDMLGAADMVNIIQHYGLDQAGDDDKDAVGIAGEEGRGRGWVLVLPVEGVMRGVVCIERRKAAAGAGARSTGVFTSSEQEARQAGKSVKSTYVIRHLIIDLPERTRRQAATALVQTALSRIFSTSSTSTARTVSSTAGKMTKGTSSERPRERDRDRLMVLTDPMSLEGEKFYHEVGFTKVVDTDMDGVVVGADLDAVPVSGGGVLGALGGLGGRGKGVWLEITRKEWEERGEKSSSKR